MKLLLNIIFFPLVLALKAFKFGWSRNKLVTGIIAAAIFVFGALAGVASEDKPGGISKNKTNDNRVEALVVRVVDGDTFEIKGGQKVRLIGVDTPESTIRHEPYGKEASAYTKTQLLNKKVYLEKDVSETDKYGRLLRYVYLGNGIMFNELLVKQGYANTATYPPDVKYKDKFIAAERVARENNRGLWGLGFVSPKPTNTNTQNQELSGKYVASENSDKYHYPECKWAKKILPENLVKFKGKIDAENHGYEPCGICRP